MRQVFFKVKYNDIGVPQENMKNIFEPLVQEERTLSHKLDGVGLDLSIAKDLVELRKDLG